MIRLRSVPLTNIAALLMLCAGACWRPGAAFGESASVVPSPGPTATAAPTARATAAKAQATRLDGPNVLHLLNQAINWYRGLEVEQQLVEEPGEKLMLSQNRERAAEILKLAFLFGDARASAIAAGQKAGAQGTKGPTPGSIEAQLAALNLRINQGLADAQKLQKQLAAAPRAKRDDIAHQLNAAQSELDLDRARADALTIMNQFQSSGGEAEKNELQSQVDELERTVLGEGPEQPGQEATPKAAANSVTQPPPPLIPERSGILPVAQLWLDLRNKSDVISERVQATERLRNLFDTTIDELLYEIAGIDGRAHSLASETANAADAGALAQRKKDFQSLLALRKQLTDAMLPLSQSSLLLQRYSSNLSRWHGTVEGKVGDAFHSLATRLAVLATTLGAILIFGMAWKRLATRYIEDTRRRRQVIRVRDMVVGALIVLVMLFNFISEIGSLATVIGLGAAGIAVALQDVILSIAGYFRVSGRYGIRAGDLLELQGVRGEVIEVGLTKLAMMELGGEAGERGPTGRIAVLPNSLVFREKFINRGYGSYFAWAEIALTIAPDCDYRLAEKRLVDVVDEVFARYRETARREAHEMERRLDLQMDSPRPRSQIRVTARGIEILVRYPVNARNQIQVADEISRRLLDSFAREPGLRLVPSAQPNIQKQPEPTPEAEPEGAAAANGEAEPVRPPFKA